MLNGICCACLKVNYLDITTVNVTDTTATLKEKIKILGVTLDNHLTMDSQVSVLSVCFLPHPCLATHTAGHYRRSSQNHRLFIRYLPSRLCQLSAVWNLGEKYSSPSANAEHHRTSRSRFFGV